MAASIVKFDGLLIGILIGWIPGLRWTDHRLALAERFEVWPTVRRSGGIEMSPFSLDVVLWIQFWRKPAKDFPNHEGYADILVTTHPLNFAHPRSFQQL